MSTLVPFPAWFVSRQPQQDTGFEVPLLFSSFQLTDSKAFNSNYTFGIGTKFPKASIYAGGLLAVTLLGWAAGGVAAGVLADYLGRRRTLMLSILCYAVFAGLAALSWNYWSLLVFRSLTGLGLGAEWGPGAAIVAEFWPPASRGRAGGVLHAAYGVGLLLAAGIWLLLNRLGTSSWRYMFVIGILPE